MTASAERDKRIKAGRWLSGKLGRIWAGILPAQSSLDRRDRDAEKGTHDISAMQAVVGLPGDVAYGLA